MAKKYDQYCPVAHALEVVGERWSLLLVRELLHGPLRYTDLQERLPGIGTNILACRLRDLEADGVIAKRKLPPPTPVTVYELTDWGRALHPVLHELAHWGVRVLGPPDESFAAEPGWLEHALRLAISLAAPPGTFVFHVGDEVASLVDGSAEPGEATDPDVVVRTDPPGFYDLFVGRRLDAVELEGDRALLERLVAATDFQPAVAAPA
jgi:DNA-binding HxlR family transcriptional regulator